MSIESLRRLFYAHQPGPTPRYNDNYKPHDIDAEKFLYELHESTIIKTGKRICNEIQTWIKSNEVYSNLLEAFGGKVTKQPTPTFELDFDEPSAKQLSAAPKTFTSDATWYIFAFADICVPILQQWIKETWNLNIQMVPQFHHFRISFLPNSN